MNGSASLSKCSKIALIGTVSAAIGLGMGTQAHALTPEQQKKVNEVLKTFTNDGEYGNKIDSGTGRIIPANAPMTQNSGSLFGAIKGQWICEGGEPPTTVDATATFNDATPEEVAQAIQNTKPTGPGNWVFQVVEIIGNLAPDWQPPLL
jgi:hypothetical protein